jgi:ABC-type amino acid transport substrate-binding protein
MERWSTKRNNNLGGGLSSKRPRIIRDYKRADAYGFPVRVEQQVQEAINKELDQMIKMDVFHSLQRKKSGK